MRILSVLIVLDRMLISELNERDFNLTKKIFPILTENYIAYQELVKKGLRIGIMPEEIEEEKPLVVQAL